MKFAHGLRVAVLSLVACAASLAEAGTPLIVQADQSQVLMLDADPATIIVGNPSIADVSINGRQLFIHGHAFGETNLMIFDSKNNKIADFELTVSHDTSNKLSMYVGNATSGAARYTFSCAPGCERSMMPGDQSAWMQNVVNDSRTKNDYATGVKTSDLIGKSGPGAAPAN